MNFKFTLIVLVFILIVSFDSLAQTRKADNEPGFLSWNIKTAQSIGKYWRRKGRVGGYFDTRVFNTNSSYNFKLKATLMSPDAIRASARMAQLRERLSNDKTKQLVSEAEQEDLVVIVEIDPREGSGVIPNNWRAFIGAKSSDGANSIRGKVKNQLRKVKALNAVGKRDYDYDIFWVSFRLRDEKGNPIWSTIPDELRLVVGIKEKEGTVTWKVNGNLRKRLEKLLNI